MFLVIFGKISTIFVTFEDFSKDKR